MPRGKKSKYDDYVKPHLKDIKKWAITMTEEQMAEKLGVKYKTFLGYKKKHTELTEAIVKGRQNLVAELKSVLVMKARGFKYTETKTIEDTTGYKKTETVEKYAPPDVAAANLLLKNYDRDNWANDPQMLDVKKRELELKEKESW